MSTLPPSPPAYDPQEYWTTLHRDASLRAVGQSGLPAVFNVWLYRIGRRNVRAFMRRHGLADLTGLSVLDIGSGTGFWIDVWRSMGASAIDGVELVPAAVERLRVGLLARPARVEQERDQRLGRLSERHERPAVDAVEVDAVKPEPRPEQHRRGLRVRLVSWLARRFGTRAVLPIVERAEIGDAGHYDGMPDATAAMATDERIHARVLAGLERVLERHAEQTVVVVSHVAPIKTLVARALDAPLESIWRMQLSPASVSVVSFFPEGRSSLRLYNARPSDAFSAAASAW